jgi:uncharacterized DUF497 family protein
MFTWDLRKAKINLSKHGISFEEAATVFSDPGGLHWEDIGHSTSEARFKRLGVSIGHRMLIVIYTVRRTSDGKETIRIISARQASRKERKAYAG